MSIKGPRTLGQQFDGAVITTTAGPPPAETIIGSDWKKIDSVTWVNRQYFDLSALTLQDLTFFMAGIDIQEGWLPTGDMDGFSIVDLVTTEKVPDDDIVNSLESAGGVPAAPVGFLRSTFNMDQILYGRTRTYLTNSTLSPSRPFQVGTAMWGNGRATAAGKLYLTRYVITSASLEKTLSIPPANFLVASVIAEEKELQYLMRLKRSYEMMQRS